MINTQEKIKIFLNEFIKNNWKKFNKMHPSSQMDVLLPPFKEIEQIISEHDLKNNDFFREVYSILDSFSEKYEKPEIRGHHKILFSYTIINGKGGGAILEKFKSITRNLEYLEYKKNSDKKCDCELALKFNRHPLTDSFNHIGYYDYYEGPSLYECEECKHRWITYTIQDDMGGTAWEKPDPDDEQFLRYY